jgi:ribosomal protein L20
MVFRIIWIQRIIAGCITMGQKYDEKQAATAKKAGSQTDRPHQIFITATLHFESCGS